MSRKPAAPSCARCIHCSPINETDGACRRFPPVPLMRIDGQITTAFPIVRMADFSCGEFETTKK